MRRIGAHVSTSGGINNAINNTLAIGGNCMQIFAGSPRMWARSPYDQKSALSFRARAIELDLSPVYIHALYLTNLASDNSELVEKSKTALIMDMENSAAIGAAGVILHIGSHQGRGWGVVRSQVITQIQDVLNKTPLDSILVLENDAGQNGKIGSLEELHEILVSIPSDRLKICLDTAHTHEGEYDLAAESGFNQWIVDIEKYIGWDKLVVLHLNDSKTVTGSHRDMHENIGEGEIGVTGMRRLLNHKNLATLPLLLEVPGTDKMGPDQRNVDIVRSLIS
ncbi:MAG: deoxyribonuclease IV [bacterium]